MKSLPDDWLSVVAWVELAWQRLAVRKAPKVDRGYGFICYCPLCSEVRKATIPATDGAET